MEPFLIRLHRWIKLRCPWNSDLSYKILKTWVPAQETNYKGVWFKRHSGSEWKGGAEQPAALVILTSPTDNIRFGKQVRKEQISLKVSEILWHFLSTHTKERARGGSPYFCLEANVDRVQENSKPLSSMRTVTHRRWRQRGRWAPGRPSRFPDSVQKNMLEAPQVETPSVVREQGRKAVAVNVVAKANQVREHKQEIVLGGS